MNTQKIQTSTDIRGFTLVELIVVITILVILGTIAFLNLGGMSGSARDSQRTSDLNQINQQIMVLQAKNGVPYTSMLSGTVANAILNPSIAGGSGTTSNYGAGDVAYTILGIDIAKFHDPSTTATAYKMGATTLDGGVYELAATLEENKKALVMGTFLQRKTTTATSTGTAAAGVISISSTNLGVFKIGDIIKLNASNNTGAITRISADLKSITTDSGTFNSNAYQFALNADEVVGLVGSG